MTYFVNYDIKIVVKLVLLNKKTYIMEKTDQKTKTVEQPAQNNHLKTPKKTHGIFVTCGVFATNRCTICGSYFDDTGEVCNYGHVIGQTYRI